MNPEIKERWLTALKSGKYTQCKFFLHKMGGKGNCCLGVLAWEMGAAFERESEEDNFEPVAMNGSPIARNWQHYLPDEMLEAAGLEPKHCYSLARANDNSDDYRKAIKYIEENL